MPVTGDTPPTAFLPKRVRDRFEVHEWRHAIAILKNDFRSEFDDIVAMLDDFQLHESWNKDPGGNRSPLAAWVDSTLGKRGWKEIKFDTQIKVDQATRGSPTHKVDCFKNKVALEVEWNNKDPLFDRDLNNFRLLFDLRVVSVGVIFTRSDELQSVFNAFGRGPSYGNSTTHMSKLLPRIEGGGGGCPLLVNGIRKELLTDAAPL